MDNAHGESKQINTRSALRCTVRASHDATELRGTKKGSVYRMRCSEPGGVRSKSADFTTAVAIVAAH